MGVYSGERRLLLKIGIQKPHNQYSLLFSAAQSAEVANRAYRVLNQFPEYKRSLEREGNSNALIHCEAPAQMRRSNSYKS